MKPHAEIIALLSLRFGFEGLWLPGHSGFLVAGLQSQVSVLRGAGLGLSLWYFTGTLDPYLFWAYWVSY